MRKSGFTIVEVIVVFLLILSVTFLTLPKNLDTTKKARFISKWSQKYNELGYMFSVIQAQKDSEIRQKIGKSQNDGEREDIIINVIKPYLRITSKVDVPYNPRYMNGLKVNGVGKYYFNNYYFTSSNEIVGLKLINADCKKNEVCASLFFDINGIEPPNKWGYDIYGVDVLKDKIIPFGENASSEDLRKDCSKQGSGVFCSYYYLIGGRFD